MSLKDIYEATPDDPWWVDPADLRAVMEYAHDHVQGSISCTHGRDFTYDFCPFANGNITKALALADTKVMA